MSPAPQKKSPQPDVVHKDIVGAEKRLRALKSAFGAVSCKWDRKLSVGEFFRLASVFAVTAMSSFGFAWYLSNSPWPVAVTLKHLAAFPNCQTAEMVGLAPSRRGQPGYWSHHDADDAGIACEVPRWRTRNSIAPVIFR